MLVRACVAALVLTLAVASAQARNTQPIKLVKPVALPQATAMDPALLEKAALEREVKKLRAENAELKKQVDALTSLGGSQVHAYCPAGSNTISRNTAGAQTDCGAAGYTCEPVSGLCRTSCQTTDMCATHYTCDVAAQQCVRTS